jgi:hypothetical protein
MAQLFKIRSNMITKLTLLSLAGGVIAFFGAGVILKWSPYYTLTGVSRMQPIQFSHKHHVRADGLDCRYCHTSVETSSSAGMPSTETCMTCHSMIWTESALLRPVRNSFFKQKPIHWNRVNILPDYVFFNHSIHVNKGVGCATCHGKIDQMPLTWKKRTFYMKDCLSCHREPEKYIRPREEVFNLYWKGPTEPKERLALGRSLIQQYNIDTHRITNCYTCHR